MIQFLIYLKNGDIIRTGACASSDMHYQAQEGELVMEGAANPDTQWVVNGAVVDLPSKPQDTDYPDFYVFNYSTAKWDFDSANASSAALSDMDYRLRDGPDRISPLWWDSMTADVKAAWSQYRLDLLNIVNQPGYPKAIVWPDKPAAG